MEQRIKRKSINQSIHTPMFNRSSTGVKNTKCYGGKLDIHMQKKEFGPFSHTIYNNQLKMYWRLKCRPESVKLLEEKMGKSSWHWPGIWFFWIWHQKHGQQNQKRDKWDCIKLKIFCTAKEKFHRMERQPMELEKIFVNPTSDKRLISKVCKEFMKLNSKKINNLILKSTKDLNRCFSINDTLMANRYMKRCST